MEEVAIEDFLLVEGGGPVVVTFRGDYRSRPLLLLLYILNDPGVLPRLLAEILLYLLVVFILELSIPDVVGIVEEGFLLLGLGFGGGSFVEVEIICLGIFDS